MKFMNCKYDLSIPIEYDIYSGAARQLTGNSAAFDVRSSFQGNIQAVLASEGRIFYISFFAAVSRI